MESNPINPDKIIDDAVEATKMLGDEHALVLVDKILTIRRLSLQPQFSVRVAKAPEQPVGSDKPNFDEHVGKN